MNGLIAILVFLSALGAQANPFCSTENLQKFSAEARTYMQQNNLIRNGEEMDFPALGIPSLSWQMVKATLHNNTCLVVMSVGMQGEPSSFGGMYEVLVAEPKSSNSIRFAPFRERMSIPSKIIAKIGRSGDAENLSFYYVELSGYSVEDALKSHFSKTPYAGFSGIAVLGKKAAFDPTPARNWKVTEGKYNLRRGMTGEGMDVQAYQLDGLGGDPAAAYWEGCFRPQGERDRLGFCELAPWGQAFILDVLF